jgi:hypothetical protein
VKIVGFLSLLAVSAFVAPASAAVVYSYDETGCFGSSCLLSTSANDGHLSFSHQAETSVSAGTVDLGTFTLNNGTSNYNGDAFSLDVTFTVPTGGSNIYTATLSGSITGNHGGPVLIDFNNTAYNFGSFTLAVNDLSLTSAGMGTAQELTGTLTTLASPVPEASTWAMMILGFAGIGTLTYRRRKSAMLAA